MVLNSVGSCQTSSFRWLRMSMIIATLRMLTSTLDKRVLSLPESMQVSWHRHKPQEVAVVDSFPLVGDEKWMRMMSAGQDVQSRLPMVFVQRRVNQHQENINDGRIQYRRCRICAWARRKIWIVQFCNQRTHWSSKEIGVFERGMFCSMRRAEHPKLRFLQQDYAVEASEPSQYH